MKSGPLGSAYDRAEFIQQRRDMMQKWADYCEELRDGEPIDFAAASVIRQKEVDEATYRAESIPVDLKRLLVGCGGVLSSF